MVPALRTSCSFARAILSRRSRSRRATTQPLESLSATAALGALLAGILTFFMLEKFVLWRHCHTDDCEAHDASVPLVLIGGALHNLTDGVIVGAALLTSVPLGLTTALAVAAHQIPQEVSDYAILLDAGYSRARAFASLIATATLY